jgi:N12 class adenine-specific DNA methylase
VGAGERRTGSPAAGQVAAAGQARFRPGGQEDLAPSGAVARVRANLAALRTVRRLERENGRAATGEEQAVLARWSGWGAVPEVFDPSREDLVWARDELALLLSADELAAAARNTLNAHYTDAELVKAIWAGVQDLGFTRGQVLEPGCGSGNFIGFAPDGAQVTGVELEPVTARIAAALYPDALIRTESFADTKVPGNAFSLTIGNVPFGAIKLHDRKHNPGGHSIHAHFIIKSLELTRPGGIVAVLTSRYVLDARNPAARREIAGIADLVGAVRLPTGAHWRAAGTHVVTDLLVFRRREPGREPDATAWEQVRAAGIEGADIEVSEYFLDNPGRVIGRLTASRGAYGAGELAVVAAEDTVAALARVLREIADSARQRDLTWSPGTAMRGVLAGLSPAAEVASQPDGYLRARADGLFTQVADGQVQLYEVPRSQVTELRRLIGLRDMVMYLLEAEAVTVDDTSELDALRRDLGILYDRYCERFGPVNRFTWRRTGRVDPATGEERLARVSPPQGGFRADPFAPAVLALEDFDPVSQKAVKAAIFTRRVVAPRNPRLGADSPADALAICLDLCGEVRLTAVARLLGTDEDQARRELGTLVFDEPATNRLVPAAEYLSGLVRDKLKTAIQAAAQDPRYAINAEHLTSVIPADLGPGEIDARLGAAWIDAAYVEQFLREILDDSSVQVEHPGGQVWAVKGPGGTVLATSTWGTARYPAPHLAHAVLEQRPIEVRDRVGDSQWVLNIDETIAAQAKAVELAERFSGWVWEDPARAGHLAGIYNDRLNGIVLRSYDDAELSLPGLALGFEPRPHQIAAVARMIHEPAVGLFHEVGAGKTAEMTMGVMELRRLGLVRKPAIVVPNHMLLQFGREFAQLYPQARILVAQRDDLTAGRRRLFIARCATGDWDAVIMSRSAFERIPLSPDKQRDYLNRELDKLRSWIAASRSDRGMTVKRIEAAVVRAEERLKARLDGAKDPGITFEATGIDYLCVDEAHGYKNLRTVSNIPDAAIAGSMRASDLDMKISYLRDRNGARVVTFATATPIANSITEAYVMQHYLRPDLLQAAGIEEFDTWAATFSQTVTQIEMAPEGGGSFRQKTRFAKFTNVPELLRMWHVSADIKTSADLNLPTPALARRPGDGQRVPETVVVQPSADLLAYVADLGERAGKVRSRAVRPEEDNMLKVTGDGRKAALDLRLVGLPMTGPGKIEVAADNIAALWHAHRDDIYPAPDGQDSPVRGSLQIVFSDLGTPSDGWNVYGELRDQLAVRGVQRTMIRFIHEARTDRDKGELFAACRAGSVAVLIGSTEKMGVGTNVQTRAIALHHLDCPWRPADMAQREGRILRQGNRNKEVRIFRYVTERSFDGYLFQTVERKARFIAQVIRGRLDVREIDDIGDAALSYDEVKALATGNPLLLAKAEADAELTRLQRAERAHHRNQRELQRTITSATKRVAGLSALAGDIDNAIGRRRDTRGDSFTMSIDGVRHDKRHEAGQHLRQLVQQQLGPFEDGGRLPSRVRHGNLAGFDAVAAIRYTLGATQITLDLDGAPDCAMTTTPDVLDTTDPTRLIVGMENRLAGLDKGKARALSEIGRLETEIARAREDAAKAFPLSGQLHDARRRATDIEHQLHEAAKTSAQGNSPPGEAVRSELATAGSREPGRRESEPASEAEQVKIAQRDFPERAPAAVVRQAEVRPVPSAPIDVRLAQGIR